MRFYVQHHLATADHYDLRLEVEDGYRSWALPKGLPTKPGEVRLAVPTDLHPKDYFLEGKIEEGYGTGTVQLWDAGQFRFKDEPLSNKWNIYVDSARVRGGYYTLLQTIAGWIMIFHEGIIEDIPVDLSVLSGRTLEEIRMAMPFKPALAKLVDEIPVGNFIYQEKYDGYRLTTQIGSESVVTTNYPEIKTIPREIHLASRTGEDWTERFASIKEAVKALDLPDGTKLDGEIVVIDDDGLPNFEKLHAGEGQPVYLVFDVPSQPGTLQERLEWLYTHLPEDGTVRVAPYTYEPFNPCERGMEGLIAKDLGATYPFDKRGWFKYKCVQEQELVVFGYTTPKGSREHIGALLVGYYKDGQPVYAGRVGTGFNQEQLQELSAKLQDLPTTEPLAKIKGATWVEPKLVAQVKFMNWTKAGMLRHPSFVSLRDDKNPLDVVREIVELTHMSKRLWPEITKGDLASHYQKQATGLLEELKKRPISLYRCPDGIDKDCFWQRNAALNVPGLNVVDINGRNHYILTDKRGLMSLAQLNVVEVHEHNYTLDNTDSPDRLIFDIDPPDGTPFEAVVETAKRIKTKIEAFGLRSYPKTTGGNGLHIVVPIKPQNTFEEAQAFCKKISSELIAEDPALYSDVPSKSKIYLDCLRNDRLATTICPWSPRATPEALVATIVTWEALENIKPNMFHILGEKLDEAYREVAGRMHRILSEALPN